MQSQLAKKPQTAKRSDAPSPVPLLLWAFTRRLPTMRRCLRKFLKEKARVDEGPQQCGCWLLPTSSLTTLRGHRTISLRLLYKACLLLSPIQNSGAEAWCLFPSTFVSC